MANHARASGAIDYIPVLTVPGLEQATASAEGDGSTAEATTQDGETAAWVIENAARATATGRGAAAVARGLNATTRATVRKNATLNPGTLSLR